MRRKEMKLKLKVEDTNFSVIATDKTGRCLKSIERYQVFRHFAKDRELDYTYCYVKLSQDSNSLYTAKRIIKDKSKKLSIYSFAGCYLEKLKLEDIIAMLKMVADGNLKLSCENCKNERDVITQDEVERCSRHLS